MTDLYSTYERINSVSPRTLLKIVLYSYMNGDYSSRSMELNCKRDINFMFLLEGASVPDHATFARFRSIHFAPCYENKARSQELNLDNKCFQQSWKHHNKAVIKLAAVSEILLMQRIRLVLPHGSHASLIPVCIGKAVFVHSFYVWLQNRIHRKECPV